MNACSIEQLCCLFLAPASLPYVQDGMVCSSLTIPIKIRPTPFPPNPNGNIPGRSDELSILTSIPSFLPIVWTAEQNE